MSWAVAFAVVIIVLAALGLIGEMIEMGVLFAHFNFCCIGSNSHDLG